MRSSTGSLGKSICSGHSSPRILGVAFEQVCIALQIGANADDVRQAIANKVIELASAGERNPDILCERVLEDIRRPTDEPSV